MNAQAAQSTPVAPPPDFAELETKLKRSALTLGGTDAPVYSDLSPQVLPLAEVIETLRDLRARRVRRVFWKMESCGGCATSALQLFDAVQRFTADGSRIVFYVPEPRYPEPEGNSETHWAYSISHDGGFLASSATMWPLAATVVMHPRAFMAIHGPVFIGAEFMPQWRERLVRFYEAATAGLMPHDLLVQLMNIDRPERAFPVRASQAVAWGLADHVGDEDFARRLALGEIDLPRRAALAARARSAVSAGLPPGRPQGIIARPVIQDGAVGVAQQNHTKHYAAGPAQYQSYFAVAFATPEPDASYAVLVSFAYYFGANNPPAAAKAVDHVVKSNTGFTVYLQSADPYGQWLTFDCTCVGLRNGG